MDISLITSFIEDASNLMVKVQSLSIQEAPIDEGDEVSEEDVVEVYDDVEVVDNDEINDKENPSPGDFSSLCDNFGCVLGVSAQTIEAYTSWKDGNISDSEFLSNIAETLKNDEFKGAVSGIMVPVSQTIAKFGASMSTVFPVAVIAAPLVGAAVNMAINQSHSRTLQQARHYQSLNELYTDFQESIAKSQYEYAQFKSKLEKQDYAYNAIKRQDEKVTSALKNLYDSI